jgi:type VI secretion system protein ImpK
VHAPANVPSLSDFQTSGLNPLVQAAVPLLVLAGRLRGQIGQADVENLRRQAIQEIRSFEERARQSSVPAEDVLAARYALCTVLDEAVLNTPWGAQSGWARESLLVTFHREASGGEKFFQILERVSSESQRYAALLELLYVCLALGFEGRYRLDARGAAQLTEIRQDLYRRIASLRGTPEAELSPRWRGVEDRRNAVLRFLPLWVVAVACIAILLGVFIFFSARLNSHSDSLYAALAKVGIEPVAALPASAPPAQPSGLATFLQPQIEQHLVSVEDLGDRTVITVTVPDLFTSGSASVNGRHEALLHEIGRALERVPGRILVVGHTDDQPVRSFRYGNNYELSTDRAVQVAKLLRADVTNGARFATPSGAGASQPRYSPPEKPENRARNRRVEIIHRRDG